MHTAELGANRSAQVLPRAAGATRWSRFLSSGIISRGAMIGRPWGVELLSKVLDEKRR